MLNEKYLIAINDELKILKKQKSENKNILTNKVKLSDLITVSIFPILCLILNFFLFSCIRGENLNEEMIFHFQLLISPIFMILLFKSFNVSTITKFKFNSIFDFSFILSLSTFVFFIISGFSSFFIGGFISILFFIFDVNTFDYSIFSDYINYYFIIYIPLFLYFFLFLKKESHKLIYLTVEDKNQKINENDFRLEKLEKKIFNEVRTIEQYLLFESIIYRRSLKEMDYLRKNIQDKLLKQSNYDSFYDFKINELMKAANKNKTYIENH